MGEAARSLGIDNPGQRGGPDLELVSNNGPERPFFDLRTISPDELPAADFDFNTVRAALRDSKLGIPEKTVLVAQRTFEAFWQQTGANPEALPDYSELGNKYYNPAFFLFTRQNSNEDAAEVLDALDYLLPDFRRISPIEIAEKVANVESLHNEPRVSLIMVKLWVAEHMRVALPQSYDRVQAQPPLTSKPIRY